MVQDDTSTDTAYQVLARKYRPQDFSALIGQEAMVRVLKNAFETGRIHHAYVLTGVRGIGKTTTARIIAKGLNCIGKDGKGGPTVEPCGECEHCTAITDGRHVDVIELDAASHTGIDDVREIIEGAKYRPAMARYKVYIIDETHMLSKNAFNGLLKTLEEPPEHVKFLFATTEIRKMPVTVLSRCQRFDLRRIAPETLSAHLAEIAEKEGVKIEESALALIARAAEGSVRDAQSLLDQAIADGAGDADTVRRMLGLADRGRVLSLFGMVMRGEAAEAIAELRDQYRSGAEPQITMAEMADTAHWLSTLKISPELGEDPSVPPELSAQAGELAASLQMKVLARAWQMLLKALEEVSRAPSPIKAAEMAIIRLCSVADMPTPGDLVKQLTEAGASGAAPSGGGTPSPSGGGPSARASGRAQAISTSQTAPRVVAANPTPAQSPKTEHARDTQHLPQDFDAIIALIREKKDGALLYDVETGVKLVDYAPGKIEFEPVQGAPSDLPSRLSAALKEWTGERWFVTLSDQPGAPTIAETRAATQQNLEARIKKHPLIAAALTTFPKAEMRVIPRKAQTVEDLPEDDFDDDEDLLGED